MVEDIEKKIRKRVLDLGLKDTELVHFGSIAELPTQFGTFEIIGVLSLRDMKEHTIIIKGNPIGKNEVPVRIHSECLTGDAFASLRCDCREQLECALNTLAKEEFGALIYARQEGRGIGLFNKLKAYTLQEQGYDTNEANTLLGFKADERSYLVPVDILYALRITSVKLITNNPKKVAELCGRGIDVTERIPIAITPNIYNIKYLATKSEDGHLMGAEALYCQDEETIE
ncbi:MAG: GTP cyclohydrolase II [Candidatus Heimdallarchaeota archaeon]|nr:GTP cyclohydrolase II [Candidatus Heimdallarchaeota archaeon]MCK4954635.1 GTP cyclohydrolase II [Candidatus Heimdallarchaeota archaeon]